MFFTYWDFTEVRRVYAGEDSSCFWNLGAYQVCDSTQHISIYSSLFLLMIQALVSRILVPGMSNFVNASVRCLLRHCCASFAVRVTHTRQILHSANDRSDCSNAASVTQD
jgi:hypothetical protein